MSKLFIPQLAWFRVFTMLLLGAGLSFLMASSVSQAQRRASEDDSSVIHDYRGIQLGMLAEEVRKKLGEPKDKGDEQDFYVFNDTQAVQIFYDKAKTVTAISIDFMSGANQIPAAKDVIGSEPEPKADGSTYKMVRYPKAGYWLSYNRTPGDAPLVSVTFQKIQ